MANFNKMPLEQSGESTDAQGQNQSTQSAKQAALRYLSLRAYGKKELCLKLRRRFSQQASQNATDEMERLGLICDQDFAVEKAKGMAQRKKSPTEIRRTLRQLGIEESLAEKAVQELEIDEGKAALQLVEKKYMHAIAGGQHQKVMAALARRGFAHKHITWAVQNAINSLGQSAENGVEEP